MDTNFSAEDLAFRNEVNAFFDEKFDEEMIALLQSKQSVPNGIIEWQKRLYTKGWAASGWPVEYGGTGWSVTQNFIYETERAARGIPDVIPFGLRMVGPIVCTFGTDEQKAKFLPRILSSEDWWCQGYSEAGSGSDLASLQTKATVDGDDYIVNGTKVWTTYAQHADWIFCLVRTDNSGKKQAGITFLLIDMKTPGITVNEIRSIDSQHTLNEVHFDNVRVPIANRIGEQDKGWIYAKSLLAHERNIIAGVADSKRNLSEIKRLASAEINGGERLIDDPLFAARVAQVEIDLMALEFTELRSLSAAADGKAPGAESSLLKLQGSEIQQVLERLKMKLAGYYAGVEQGTMSAEDIGHDFANDARKKYMHGRASTIYGGSNEVQKNITAKYVLGL